ncbi:MAG: CSLREA domain-containing protein [Agitococcus sp.]|nr:CSLREA domain-containing protein [Agitococcus sp.]
MRTFHTLFLVSFFIATQSHARTIINVNTTTDENGENTSNCSLREAVRAVNNQQAFGGCNAGERFGTNIIALENATYILNKGEIVVTHDLTVAGISADNKDLIDNVTLSKPKRLPPSTVINGNLKRIFNTANDKNATLTLQNLVITDGKADLGGGILVGGTLSLENIILINNTATESGGAIYLSGRDATLTTANSTFTKNKADKGAAVLGMSCVDYLNPIARSISISKSSIINNGTGENNSVIDGCGQVNITIETTTIAQNTAKTTGGILYFVDNIDSLSSLQLLHVTIVENKIASTFSYGKLGSLSLNSSIIAFNDRGCSATNNSTTQYNGGDPAGGYNTLQNCPLVYGTSTTTTLRTDINLNDPSNSDANFATELLPLANYGGYTDSYLPKTTSKYILNRTLDSLCVDQRGNSSPTNTAANNCDVGSVERRVAVAVFDDSQVITNKIDSDRIAEVDFLDNDIPSENDSAIGGFGKDPTTGQYLVTLTETANNRCSIDHRTEDQRPLIRFDNKGIPLLENQAPFICKYTFKDSNGNVSNAATLKFRIDNKLPVATDDTYTLPSGGDKISLDLLNNDNDKNDGIYGGLCTDTNNVTCNGLYIRVVASPSLGVIEAERTGNCPDYSDGNKFKCYGGHIKYRPNNALSPFNDKFTYVVYDIDKAASNEATVTIINETGVNEENNSGSLGLFSLLGLGGLAFYRRFRKSYVA